MRAVLSDGELLADMRREKALMIWNVCLIIRPNCEGRRDTIAAREVILFPSDRYPQSGEDNAKDRCSVLGSKTGRDAGLSAESDIRSHRSAVTIIVVARVGAVTWSMIFRSESSHYGERKRQ